ncbi:MAG: hypothetical protein LBS10_02870, partial [Gracilibacteraceae bacterium]|nr:hypothetical protein [Gracilibacteraceae bacterium]
MAKQKDPIPKRLCFQNSLNRLILLLNYTRQRASCKVLIMGKIISAQSFRAGGSGRLCEKGSRRGAHCAPAEQNGGHGRA